MNGIEQIEFVTRVLVALLLGAIIGLERSFSHHSAGLRTHILVSISACVTMIINEHLVVIYADVTSIDPGRMGAYIISGIGFIGAGAIIKNKYNVSGLTTASSIFTCAVIGLACGCGLYIVAISTTCIVLITLFLLNKLEHIFPSERNSDE